MCQSYADNWDVIVSTISGDAPTLSDIQAMNNSGALTSGQAADVNSDRLDGCTLADVVSLTTSSTTTTQSATIDAEVNTPGTEPVAVAVEFTLDGSNSKTRNSLSVSDGDAISANYTGVSSGSHTLCADIITVEAV